MLKLFIAASAWSTLCGDPNIGLLVKHEVVVQPKPGHDPGRVECTYQIGDEQVPVFFRINGTGDNFAGSVFTCPRTLDFGLAK